MGFRLLLPRKAENQASRFLRPCFARKLRIVPTLCSLAWPWDAPRFGIRLRREIATDSSACIRPVQLSPASATVTPFCSSEGAPTSRPLNLGEPGEDDQYCLLVRGAVPASRLRPIVCLFPEILKHPTVSWGQAAFGVEGHGHSRCLPPIAPLPSELAYALSGRSIMVCLIAVCRVQCCRNWDKSGSRGGNRSKKHPLFGRGTDPSNLRPRPPTRGIEPLAGANALAFNDLPDAPSKNAQPSKVIHRSKK